MKFDNSHDQFLVWSARFAFFHYAGPAAVLAFALAALGVSFEVNVLVLLVYLIGAVAHLLTWGFQASGVQSVESASKIIEAIDRTRLQDASI
jgi:Na+-transporting methylmalonyl-CoA/oxaloacetate decarboxylase gamma subunit